MDVCIGIKLLLVHVSALIKVFWMSVIVCADVC